MPKNDEKLVSIILVNWNSYELTKNCIEKIKENTSYKNYEIYMIDNGSADGSIERLGKEFPFLKITRNRKNRGFTYAINQGYKDANGPYLCHVNSDAVVLKGWLEEALKVLESSPDIAVVGATEVSQELADNKEELEKIRQRPNIEKLTLPVSFVTRKELIEKFGYYDAEYFSPAYGEESDWNFRLHNAGFRIVKASRFNVVHAGSAISRKNLGDRKYTILINYHRVRSMLFNLSIPDLLRFVPGLGLIIVNSFFTPSFFRIMKAYWLNIKDWKLILQQRKAKRSYIPFKEPRFTVVE